jgi:acetyltransferase-like isoleucine patch superfamily enzyme
VNAACSFEVQRNAVIGRNCLLGPGVTAGAVATKDCDTGALNAGVFAKRLG